MAAGGGDNEVMSRVLATTGQLAKVAGPILRPHVFELLPLVINALQDTSGGGKRIVALTTLGQAGPPCRLYMCSNSSEAKPRILAARSSRAQGW